MRHLVLGTLFCLAACSVVSGDGPGSPEDFAIPHIDSHMQEHTPETGLQSVQRKISIVPPIGWNLYQDPEYARRLETMPDYYRERRLDVLSALIYAPTHRTVCHVFAEIEPVGFDVSLPGLFAGVENQILWLEDLVERSKLIPGLIQRSWVSPGNDANPTLMVAIQWRLQRSNSNGPALGFGATDVQRRTSKRIVCYWLDGVRGDNESEILSDMLESISIRQSN